MTACNQKTTKHAESEQRKADEYKRTDIENGWIAQ